MRPHQKWPRKRGRVRAETRDLRIGSQTRKGPETLSRYLNIDRKKAACHATCGRDFLNISGTRARGRKRPTGARRHVRQSTSSASSRRDRRSAATEARAGAYRPDAGLFQQIRLMVRLLRAPGRPAGEQRRIPFPVRPATLHRAAGRTTGGRLQSSGRAGCGGLLLALCHRVTGRPSDRERDNRSCQRKFRHCFLHDSAPPEKCDRSAIGQLYARRRAPIARSHAAKAGFV